MLYYFPINFSTSISYSRSTIILLPSKLYLLTYLFINEQTLAWIIFHKMWPFYSFYSFYSDHVCFTLAIWHFLEWLLNLANLQKIISNILPNHFASKRKYLPETSLMNIFPILGNFVQLNPYPHWKLHGKVIIALGKRYLVNTFGRQYNIQYPHHYP